MALQEMLQHERMEMLKWVSERNMHVPLSDLAYMLDLREETLSTGDFPGNLYEFCSD